MGRVRNLKLSGDNGGGQGKDPSTGGNNFFSIREPNVNLIQLLCASKRCCRVQAQSLWSLCQGAKPLKLKHF